MSHPKSGRTWLQVVLGKLFELEFGIPNTVFFDNNSPRNFDNRLPDCMFTHGGSRKLVKKFNNRAYANSNVILLVRDPRDVQVSYFFQITKRRNVYQGDISSFIKHEDFGINKIIRYLNIWYENRHILNTFHVIHYEDMHSKFPTVLTDIMNVLNLPVTDQNIYKAIEYGKFENMRKMEIKNIYQNEALFTENIHDKEAFKVRRGEIGGYKEYLSENDRKYIEAQIHKNLHDFYRYYKNS